MIKASCHCQQVQLQLDHAPTEVTECNCSICRRYGVIWAYYPRQQVKVLSNADTDRYSWDDRSIEFHRCDHCGCVTHWSGIHEESRGLIGIDARLLDPALLAAARLRHLDGAGSEQYLD